MVSSPSPPQTLNTFSASMQLLDALDTKLGEEEIIGKLTTPQVSLVASKDSVPVLRYSAHGKFGI